VATLTVGPSGQFSTISAAVAAANSGDTIDVQAGTYTNDFPALIDKDLTLQGVGGMVNMVATVDPPNGKAILDVGAPGVTVTINDFAFSGAVVPDGNGAGIRYEGGNLILNDDYFHDNQDGLLSAPDLSGSITINHSEFDHNGTGDGKTHNLYVGEIGTLTVENSYFTDAVAGHEIKSRALNTIIENNRIQDGPGATSSYEIDLPNGGNALIENNVIEKDPSSGNPAMIAYGEEGIYPTSTVNSSLTLIDNTLLNELSSPSSTAILNATTIAATVTDNQFFGLAAAQIALGSLANVSGSVFLTTEPALDTSSPFVACFLVGTMILTDRGEVAVEQLAIGDRVVVLGGATKPVKWIGRRSYAAAFARGNVDVMPIRVAAGALAYGTPRRDLVISPLHALYLDEVLVPVGELVNGVTVRRCPEIDPIHYFHIELDRHDVIYAEGAPTETFVDCDSRGIFHNAAEFAVLYPGDDAQQWAFCAPRLGAGERLEALRRRLEARAGMPVAAPSPLQGFLDGLDGERLSGWAFDPARPAVPVWLEVLDGEAVIARVQANRYRADLAAAGYGDGRCGFELQLAACLRGGHHELRVRRVSDATELNGSPLPVLQPAPGGGVLEAAQRALVAADGQLQPSDEAALLATLLESADRLRRRRARRVAGAAPSAAPRRALVIDVAYPRPDHDAGSQAVLSHMAALQALGWQVEFVAADELDGVPAGAVAAQGITCHAAPAVMSVEELLRQQRDGYGLVYLHRLAVAEAYAGLARQYQKQARLVYSVADLHHLRQARQAQVANSSELMQQARALRRRELAAVCSCDLVLTHSPAEAGYLAQQLPDVPVHVVPWAVAPRRTPRRSFAVRQGMAFIGGFRHTPNLDAVRWLAEAVLPLVWAHQPNLHCAVAGPDWPAQLSWLSDPRIQLVGQVADLGALFNTVRLTVAPLRFGAGLKGKVLDSLAAGLPCAMTPMAAEGLPLDGVLAETVASSAEALARLILRLHEARDFNAACGRSGRALVAAQFSASQIEAALAAALVPGRHSNATRYSIGHAA
jgi:glycosyltransferase involved in cell wall biosynthesis